MPVKEDRNFIGMALYMRDGGLWFGVYFSEYLEGYISFFYSFYEEK